MLYITKGPHAGKRMKKSIIIIFFLSLYATATYAQREGNIWYFGNFAGLDFNSGSPVALTDGQLNTNEGCATICDANGDLLFYTDGISVWDRRHIVMPNGSGLMGHSSSTQSGVIVPKPGYQNIFYIFTVDDKLQPGGFRYSVVDLSLNGGYGDVNATKNVLLTTSTTEKITAIKHANNTDIWVIMHEWGNNNFRSYLVTVNGINTVENSVPGYPVVTSTGYNHMGTVYNKIGYMKVSSTADKLALGIYDMGRIQVFDFDNSTGVMSNPVMINNANDYLGAYGIEFSPDGSRLYASVGISDAPTRSRLYQWDLTAADIPASVTEIFSLSNSMINQIGALQLGPDRRIYVARADELSLGVINNPNGLGSACNYADLSVNLSGRYSKLGLPTFIQSFFNFEAVAHSNTPMCETEDLYLWADTVVGATYAWTGPSSFTSNQQTDTIYNVSSSNAGDYILAVTLEGLTKYDTITVVINDAPTARAGEDKTLCLGSGVTIGETATGGAAPYLYVWTPSDWLSQEDIYNPIANPPVDTTYIVMVTDINGCVGWDTVNVYVTQPIIEFPDGDTLDFGLFCVNDTKDSTFRIRNGSAMATTFEYDDTGLSSEFNVTGVIDDRQFNVGEIRSLDISFTGAGAGGTYIDSIKIVDTCSNTKTIILKAEVVDIGFEVAPDTLDFGIFCLNDIKDSSFTVKNISAVPSSVTVDLSGVSALFNVDVAVLGPIFSLNELRSVNVSFLGSASVGTYIDQIDIINECGGVNTVYLKAEVIDIGLDVQPDTLDLGAICKNAVKSEAFTVRNISSVATTVTTDLSGVSAYFTVDAAVLGPQFAINELRSVNVTFNGSPIVGIYLDSLAILNECGGVSVVYLKAEILDDFLEVLPDTLDFGSFCSNDTQDSTFSVRNISSLTTDATIDLSGLSSYFAVDGSPLGSSFAPGETKILTASWNGSAVTGIYLDSVNIIDACGETYTVYLKAAVGDIDLEVLPDTLDFGRRCMHSTKDTVFYVRNISTVPASATSDLSGVSSIFDVDVSSLSTQMAVNEMRVADVSFIGSSSAGSFLDSVKIIDECSGIKTVYLKIETYEVIYGSLPDTLDFGRYCGSGTLDTTISFQNQSVSAISFDGEILPDPNPHFEFVGNAFSSDYASGETRNITIRYVGSGFEGLYIDSLVIMDECGGSRTVILKAERSELEILNMPDSIIVCHDIDSAKIRYNIGSGAAPFTYSWSPATGLDNPTIKEPTVINPTETTYYVTVSDAAGCTAVDSVKITPIPAPNLEFEPTELDFGEIDSCETSKELSLVIRNNGLWPVTLEDISTHPAFTVLGGHARTIAAGAVSVITVRYTRNDATGQISSGKIIFTSQQCGDVYEVDVTARLKGETIAISSAGLDFGNHPDCETEDILERFTVYNRNSSLDAELGASQFIPNSGVYSILAPALPYSIPTEDSVEIVVKFAPQTNGVYNANLIIPFTIGECINNISVDLTGQQYNVELSSDRNSVNFGSLSGCEDTVSSYITITNTGSTKVNSVNAVTDGNIELDANELDKILDLDPGDSQRIKLLFRPDHNGDFSDNIVIHYQPCDQELTIAYTGSKFGINFTVSDTVDFGAFCFVENETYTGTFSITNISEGQQDGEITDFRFTGDFNQGGITTTDLKLGDILEYNKAKSYHVNFKPQSKGEYLGKIDLRFDPCDITKSIVLKANVGEINITGMPKELTMCHNIDTVKIRYEVSGGSGYIYSWSPEDGLDDPNIKEPTIIEPQETTYELTVVDATGCTTTAQVDVVPIPEPDLEFSKEELDFGIIDSCQMTRDVDFKITNNGDVPVTLTDSSTNNSFEILGLHKRTINPGQSVTIVVRFTRVISSEGESQDGKLLFFSAECGDFFEIDMTVEVKGTSIAISDPNIDFGTVLDCDDEDHFDTIRVENRNEILDAEIALSDIRPSGAFTIIKPETLPVTIGPGEYVDFVIDFSSSANGDYYAELYIPYVMEACIDTIMIRLSGEFMTAEMASDISEINFRDLSGCEDRDTAYVKLTNTGEADITSITADFDDNVFIDPNQLKLTSHLKTGESVNLMVLFTPNSNEAFADDITFTYKPCEKQIVIPYSGSKNGVNFEVTDAIDFGEYLLCDGEPMSTLINVSNVSDGGQSGAITNIVVNGDFADNQISTNGLILNDVLPNGEQKSYTLNFSPDVPGEFEGSIELTFDPCNIKKTIYLTGSATDVELTAEEDFIGETILAETLWKKDVVFRNTGTDTIVVNEISEIDTPFVLTGTKPAMNATLLPGEEFVVSLELFTDSGGIHSLDLVVSGDESCPFAARTIINIDVDKPILRSMISLPCPADTVDPGTSVVIPLMFETASDITMEDVSEFEAVIRFNKTLLKPYGLNIESDLIEDGYREITVREIAGNIVDSNIVYPIKFVSALGNTQCTDLELINFQWLNSEVLVDSLKDGCFCISGICPAYGDRLFNPDGEVRMKQIAPNPVINSVELEYELVENYGTRLSVFNMLGEEVLILFDGEAPVGVSKVRYDLGDLSSGAYYVVLQTPTVRITRRLEILK